MASSSHILITDLKGKKIGLVLGGGGFKGAYQIGAWRALKTLGIDRFHAISGTSVGALNAVLIGLNESEQAYNLWRNVPFTKWAPLNLRHLGAAIACLLSPAMVSLTCDFVILFSRLVNGFPMYSHAIPIFPLVTRYLQFHVNFLFTVRDGTALASMAIGLLISTWGAEAKVFITDTNTHWWPILFCLPLLFCMGSETLGWLLGVTGLLSSLILFYFGVWSLGCYHQNGRLLSNEDVVRRLENTLRLPALRSNVESLFVTLSERKEVPNPLWVNNRPNSKGVPDPQPYPKTEDHWLAEYHDLCKIESHEEALGVLGRTSSLPYAFSGSRASSQQWVSDGGLADNVPLLPILMTDVDYVIVIALNASEGVQLRSNVGIQRLIRRHSERRWAARLSKEDAQRHYTEYMRRSRSTGKYQEVRVEDMLPLKRATKNIGFIILAPSRPLAAIGLPYLRFLTGTINSAISFRRSWFLSGFKDMSRLLRNADQSAVVWGKVDLFEGESLRFQARREPAPSA